MQSQEPSNNLGKKTSGPIHYPLSFTSQTAAKAGTVGTWDTTSADFKSTCSVPQVFHGSGGALCPEDLFNHALTNCFLATFKVYAENSKLSFDEVKIDSLLVVDLDDTKKPVMKSVSFNVVIINPSDSEKALTLARKASVSGFILNSVKTELSFNIQVATI